MIRDAGARAEVSGAMTIATARALLEGGARLVAEGSATSREFDLAGVDEVDSAGLAIIFGWQRAARAAGREVRIVNPPENLLSLAALYGVVDLLPIQAA
ncbi:MAG: STAS domain-containing protein [Betaproteobacteria bacterium]|nr:STAS domain-containing protein [Betaproteobacteria bacterium]